MGTAKIEFNIEGTLETFKNRMLSWLSTTNEGGEYKQKDPKGKSMLKIQRGKGYLNSPMIMEIHSIDAQKVRIEGYIQSNLFGFIPLSKSSFSEKATMGGIPRKKGWKDIMHLLDYLGVKDFNHYE